ncbi:MAG: MAPEG family protein [Nevskiales bacterium]
MTTETLVLLLTLLLGLVHLSVGATIRVKQQGLFPLAGPRDDLPPVGGVFGPRAERANTNFKETLPWALALLLLVQMTGTANTYTAMGAWIYFWSRVAYLPLYVFGVPLVRTLAWAIALGGLGLIAAQMI